MSRIRAAISKYRSEVRSTKQDSPLVGVFVRSRREFAAICATSLATIAAVVIPVSVYDYSVALQAAVPAAALAVAWGSWFAWIVWGRDRFPLTGNARTA
ncbi:MAG: hypothetical protein OXT07_07375 [bacterium]|nr:hypothetical protein [bacterium]